MLDIILDTLIDGVKLLPFLFVAFIVIELFEHNFSKKTKTTISKSGKFGPFIGSLLGALPQCGFSVVATNLYTTRIVTLGTLIAIYLSTSDEMLPIMLSEKVSIITILEIIAIKVVIGMIAGFIIDLVYRQKEKKHEDYHICEEEHCDCNHGIIKSTLKHTLKTLLYIMLVSFILNIIMSYVNEDIISKIFMKNSIFAPFVASLIGFIPNCGASVIITELYLNGVMSLGTCIAGLLTGSGVALLVLLRQNKDIKNNIMIFTIIYIVGVLSGIIINLLGVTL